MSDHTITDQHPRRTLDTDDVDRRLRQQLDRSEHLLAELGSIATDADSIQEDRDSTRLTMDSVRADIRLLQHALDRLADGTYGRCQHCGEPIAPARLEAIPTASRCNRCA